jgi:protein STE50
VASDVSTATSPNANKPKGQDSNSDNLKSFKVSLDDPTWKVLPAALKKYRINNDSWQNYAMFICYGSASGSFLPALSTNCSPRHNQAIG